MRRGVKAVVVSLLAAVMLAGCAWGPKYPINYVQQNAKELANQPVTVLGVVSNSQVVPPKPLDRTRGEYDLTDKNGTTIHVTTQAAPPANGSERTVHAIVKDTTDHPYLEEQPIFIWLYAALGVLVILAVVLVYLIVKPREDGPPPPPPPPPGILCPHCGRPNDQTARFCEHCGGTIDGTSPANGSKCIYCRTANPDHAHTCSKCGETLGGTMIAVADLTLLDGNDSPLIDGDGSAVRYALKTSLKHTIGRADRNLVCLKNDRRVSEDHARVGWEDGGFFIQDEDSTNGTLVNDSRITRQPLAHGDVIQVGNTRLKFTLAGGNAGQ